VKKVLGIVDLLLLFAVASSSIVITILDYSNAYQESPILTDINYAVLTLVFLSFVGFHLVYVELERRRERLGEALREEAARILRGLRGMEITVFKTSEEMERYLAHSVSEARREVCDLSWKSSISAAASLKPRKKSQAAYEASIDRASERVTYREVFVFNDIRRIDKLGRRLKKNKPGYSCRYYPEPISVPRLQFVLVDRQEIIFASSAYPKLCAIKHTELSEIFQQYYEEIWRNAVPLIEGDKVYQEAVDEILSNG